MCMVAIDILLIAPLPLTAPSTDIKHGFNILVSTSITTAAITTITVAKSRVLII